MSEPIQEADDGREVGQVVFGALVSGLAISVVLLLAGVVSAVASREGLPKEVPSFGELLARPQADRLVIRSGRADCTECHTYHNQVGGRPNAIGMFSLRNAIEP